MFDDFLKLGPLMGPNTLFGALGQTQDHETNFFILIFISNENPLIWYVTVGIFHDFVLLSPPNRPPKTLFLGLERTHDPKNQFLH